MLKKGVMWIVVLALLNGCATVGRTTLLGVGTGAAAGTGIGLAAGNNAMGALTGAAVGAVLGGAFFFLGAKEHEEKAAFMNAPLKEKSAKEKIPSVTTPEVHRIWVPDKIDGNRFEAGHFIYLLERQSEWTKD